MILYAILGILLIAVICVVGYIGYIQYQRYKYSHIPCPSPCHFIYGHLPHIESVECNAHLIYIDWAKQYGETFVTHFLHNVVVCSWKPAHAKQILCNSKYLKPQSGFKTIQAIYGKRFLGNGLEANVNHENWAKRRRIIDPAFHQNMVATYCTIFNEVADMLVAELRKHADTGKPISMLQMLNLGTIDAIARAAYNEKLMTSYELDDIAFVSAIFNGFFAVYREHSEPFHKYLPWNWKHVLHTRNQIDFLRGRILNIIEKRLNLMKTNPENVPKDALDVIIRGYIGVYSMEDIIDDVLAIFVAGQEAAANSLSFMMLEMSRHPEVHDRITEEILDLERHELGKGEIEDGSKVIPGNNDLEYTLATLKETLRLYPIVEETYRVTPPNEDTMLDQYKIPPDTTISTIFFPMHYLLFKDGFEFEPLRFMPDTPESKGNPDLSYAYLPFSLGQRACLGKPFAYSLSKIILYRMYREFRFEADPTQSYDCLSGLTIRPVGGAMFSVYTR